MKFDEGGAAELSKRDPNAPPVLGQRMTMVVPKPGVTISADSLVVWEDDVETCEGVVTHVGEDGSYTVRWDPPTRG